MFFTASASVHRLQATAKRYEDAFNNWTDHGKRIRINAADFFAFNGVNPKDKPTTKSLLYYPEFMANACKIERTFKRADGGGKITVPAGSLICQNSITEIIISLMAGELIRKNLSINFVDTFYFATCRQSKDEIKQYTFMERIDTSLDKIGGYVDGKGVQKPPVFGKAPTEEEIVSLYLQVVHALAVLQNKFAIVHGDLHTDNVFIEKIRPETMWNGEKIVDSDVLEFKVDGHPSLFLSTKDTPYLAKLGDWGLSVKYPTKTNNTIIGDQHIFEDGYDQSDGNGPWTPNFYSKSYDVAYFTARMHVKFNKNMFIQRVLVWMMGFDPDHPRGADTADAFKRIFMEKAGWRPNVKDGVLTEDLAHVSPHSILTNPALMGKYLKPPTGKVLTVANDSSVGEYIASPKRTKTKLPKAILAGKAIQASEYMYKVQRGSASPKVKTGVISGMRRTVVGWMVDVSNDLNVTEEGFMSSVAILDAYLGLTKVNKSELQAVACAAMYFGFSRDIEPREEYFENMGSGNCSKAEQQRIRTDMLDVFTRNGIDYNDLPNTVDYLKMYSAAKLIPRSSTRYYYALYALYVAATESIMLKYTPDQIAACAIILGRVASGIPNIDPLKDIEVKTGMTLTELKPCLKDLEEYCTSTSFPGTQKQMHEEVYRTFNMNRYNNVSSMKLTDMHNVFVRM